MPADSKNKTEDAAAAAVPTGSASGSMSAATGFDITALHGITKFSGDDKTYSSTKYCEDIEDNAEIFNLTAQQTLIIARRNLTGTAALWIKSEKVFKTYAELKAALQKEFPDQINAKEMHELMAARKKRKEETCYQYMLTMKELGKRAKFPDYVSIQYIIDGIVDSEVNKAILYGVTTYSAFKEKLIIYEKIRSKMTTSKQEEKRQSGKRHDSIGVRRCYKCGEPGHLASDCEKGIKCFRCNKSGHIGRHCTAMSTASTAASAPPTTTAAAKHSNIGAPVRKAMFTTVATNESEESECYDSEAYHWPTGETAQASNDRRSMSQTSTTMLSMEDVNVMRADVNVTNINKDGVSVKNICIGGVTTKALIDSGSDVNLINMELREKLSDITVRDDNTVLSGLGRSKVVSRGVFSTCITVDGQCFANVSFHIVDKVAMPYDIIIGQEFLKNVTMIMNEGSVVLMRDSDEWLSRMNCLMSSVDVCVLDQVRCPEVKKEVLRCIRDYKPVQTKEAPIQLKIVLKDDIPVTQRPRRLSLMEQKIVEDQVQEWLDNNIIRVSYSEYSSPLVLVKKKDGSTRVCVDYRLLNCKMVKDEFPLPVMEDLIDKLVNAKVYSVLDLKNGFFHLKVSEESIQYTSFVSHHGQFEFLRAPFGLSVCPKYFMRFISIIFRDLIAQGIIVVFIDDILIPAKDEVQALERLKQVLAVASEYGLQINWNKANLICREIEYLGHKISNGEVRPSSDKTDAVVRYPEPRNVKQLHSFVGLISYFRKYIQNYALIAKPLTDLLKKDAIFQFNDVQRQAFQMLKQKLATPPVLKIFNPQLKTELHTDASAVALSAILMQQHDTGLHPVHYMSRKTSEVQSRYSSYELEALAIIEGLRKFRHYLFGLKFKIITDCRAFELTLRKRDLTPKIARWVMFLNEFDFQIEHRVASKMAHVDALSRYPYVAVVCSLQDNIRVAQDQDSGLHAIKEILKEKSYEDYWLENNILYKGAEKKLVIPKALENDVIKRIHGNGHFSRRKMKELVSRDYYIQNLDKKIEEFIISCIPCLLATRKAGKQEGFLNPIDKGDVPLDTIHLDHIGPLTETRKQYNYILTMVDGFTKFVWLFPTKTTSSSETLNKLQIHQQAFGNPRRIITDRGTAFTSHEFENYCKEEDIQHIKITTGVPRGNGQVERIHRIMIPTLTKLCLENPSMWYKHVSRLQRCLNSTYQRSINTTPFELLVGTRMRCKEDIRLIDLLEEEMVEQYNENREEKRKEAKEQILKIQEENRKTFNSSRKESSKYNIGDLVAIKRTQFGVGLKLKAKYLGPYRVTKVKRNDRYDLEKVDSSTEGPIKTGSTADQMKRWPRQEGDSLD